MAVTADGTALLSDFVCTIRPATAQPSDLDAVAVRLDVPRVVDTVVCHVVAIAALPLVANTVARHAEAVPPSSVDTVARHVVVEITPPPVADPRVFGAAVGRASWAPRDSLDRSARPNQNTTTAVMADGTALLSGFVCTIRPATALPSDADAVAERLAVPSRVDTAALAAAVPPLAVDTGVQGATV